MMFAAHREQENLAFRHQAAASSKQQNLAKTPGARFPKTPLKIPLNDENAVNVLGGKSVLQTRGGAENKLTQGKGENKLDKTSVVTPFEPRTARAPLGNKTTNAKARTGQATGVKDIVRELEKTQVKPTTTKKLKQHAPQLDSSKLDIHNDSIKQGPAEEDIEYAPPRPKEPSYESDIFSAGALTFEALKPENMFKGYYDFYYNPLDENGVPLQERQMKEQQEKAFRQMEEQALREFEEMDWSVGDVPGTKDYFKRKQLDQDPKNRVPKLERTALATIASRKAASALSVPSRSSTSAQPVPTKPTSTVTKGPLFQLPGRKVASRPPPMRASSSERISALAASRSTLGYSKGRAASTSTGPPLPSAPPRPQRTLQRSVSTASSGSDVTITPARFAQSQANSSADRRKSLEFLSIFDVEEEEDDGLLVDPASVQHDEADDNFQLQVTF